MRSPRSVVLGLAGLGLALTTAIAPALGIPTLDGTRTHHSDGHAAHPAGHTMTMPSVPPTRAAGTAVTVSNFAFSPSVLRTTLGATVTWTFPDAISHTATSTQGFFSSGPRASGAKFAHPFTSAGTYAYMCTIHPSMTGAVKVPLKATGTPSSGWRIDWATVAGTAETTYDAQVRRPGSDAFVAFRTATVKKGAKFDPTPPGTYQFRARTKGPGGTTGWSPVRSVLIS